MASRAVAGPQPSAAARPHRGAFLGLAAAVAVVDQVAKWVVSETFAVGSVTSVVGDLVRIAPVANSGAIFGLFPDRSWLFGLLSLGVLGAIVWIHARGGTGGPAMSVALGLLLGGAVGNLVDRFRLGYVLDFVDIGIGDLRWYTFNVADAAISTSIVLLLVLAVAGERLGLVVRR